jgi:hypothetical protein
VFARNATGTDGHINVGREHWFFCKQHRVKWLFGAKLFSTWKTETEAEQRRSYDELGFDKFETIPCPALMMNPW